MSLPAPQFSRRLLCQSIAAGAVLAALPPFAPAANERLPRKGKPPPATATERDALQDSLFHIL